MHKVSKGRRASPYLPADLPSLLRFLAACSEDGVDSMAGADA